MDEKKFKFIEGKTAVSQLQERLIRVGIKPKYDLVYDSTTRPCAVTKFTWQVSIEGITVHGTGNTKKSAKQEAAKNMLIQISRDEEIGLLQGLSGTTGENFVNHIGNLTKFCSRNSLPQPNYKEYESDGPPHIRQFFCDCYVAKYMETGIAKTKKDAKQRSAQQMYEKLLSEIPNPNDATAAERRPESAFPCKIEKTDPWLKSEKIKSRGVEPPETSDGEEYRAMSPEPNYEASTRENVDPTRAVDYRPGYRSAGEEMYQESSSDCPPQELPNPPIENINTPSEEMLEKKFKINLSLFARSNIYKEAQSAESIDAAFNAPEALDERSGGDERNNAEVSTNRSVKMEKMEGSICEEEGGESEPLEAEADVLHQEEKPNFKAEGIRPADTTELSVTEEAPLPETPDTFVVTGAVKIKSERSENAFLTEVHCPSEPEQEVDVLDHEITPKVEVSESQGEISPSDQPESTSGNGEPLPEEPAAASVELDSKSSIANLLYTIKSKYPELLTSPKDQGIEADSRSEPEDKSPSTDETSPQSPAATIPPEVPAASLSFEVSEESCKVEMMDVDEMMNIEEEFTSEEKAEHTNNPEEKPVIEMNNNSCSTMIKLEALDVKQSPSLMPIITMQSEVDRNSSSELRNRLHHVKHESGINSVPIKSEMTAKSDSIDRTDTENQQNAGDLDAQSGGDLNAQFGGDFKAQNGGDFKAQNVGDLNAQNGGDLDAQNGGDLNSRNGGDFKAQNGRDLNAQNGGDFKAQNGGDLNAQNDGEFKAQDGSDFKAQNGGDSSGQDDGDSDAQNGGDFNAKTIVSNTSEPEVRIKEFDRKRVSEYHHMMMNEHGIDLRQKVLGKICDLIEAMMKCDSNKNPQIVDEGIMILHDILLLIDLFLCKVTYRAHDLHYIVVIHVNSISEIVEVIKGGDLNEITRIAFFRVIEKLKKILQ